MKGNMKYKFVWKEVRADTKSDKCWLEYRL